MFEIVRKEMLNPTTALLEIHAPEVAEKVRPGQFIMLRIDDRGERIPLTVADFDPGKGTVTIIAQMIGYTTVQLASLGSGACVLDLIGPLGRPSELEGYHNIAVIGGGVGCAIAYPQAKYLYGRGAHVDIIAGFRTKELVILEKEMTAASNRLFITTDDGSYREHGFVTTKLKALTDAGNDYDLVVAIGPVVMMRAVAEQTRPLGIKTIVSLNPIMIDGTGMCGGCRVSVGGRVKFACVDGPDFDGHLVDFDSLVRRNNAYKTTESAQYEHACRIFRGEE